jgi:protein-S-isoprenylcysteine O-methyltransferase Ste14
VTLWGWLAALVLFLQLPIPLYWFVVHPQVKFWRRHRKAAYITGLLCSWPPVTAAIVIYRAKLFGAEWPSAAALAIGLGLIICEIWIFWLAHRSLGTARLVGKTELSGAGEIEHRGIYARIRHPRYAGSFLAIVGACLLAGTRLMWAVAGVWLVFTLIAISFEERELRARFGPTHLEYCRRVPRFFPSFRKV